MVSGYCDTFNTCCVDSSITILPSLKSSKGEKSTPQNKLFKELVVRAGFISLLSSCYYKSAYLARHVNNELTICIKENVFWFQVPIDDALAVQMFNGERNFCQIEAEIPPEKVV